MCISVFSITLFGGCKSENRFDLQPYDSILSVSMSGNASNIMVISKNDSRYYLTINDIAYGAFNSLSDVAVSESGNHYGFILPHAGKSLVMIDNVTNGIYDWAGDMTFSSNGDQYGYLYEEDGDYYVSYTGEELGSFDQVGKLFFGKNDSLFTFLCQTDGDYYFVVNGEEFEAVHSIEIEYSDDGSAYGYTYHTRWRDFINLNGDVYGGYTQTETPGFSGDGSSGGFAYIEGGSYYGKYFVNVDGENYGPFDETRSPVFSYDGLKYAYVYATNDRYYVNAHNKDYGGFSNVNLLQYNRSGSILLYVYTVDGGYVLATNGTDIRNLSLIPDVIFLPDDKQFALSYQSNSQYYLELLTNRFGPYDEEMTLNFVADSDHYWFTFTTNGEDFIHIDDKVSSPYQKVKDPLFYDLDGNPDTLDFVYSYQFEDKWYIQVNEDIYGPYLAVDYVITPETNIFVGYATEKYSFINRLR